MYKLNDLLMKKGFAIIDQDSINDQLGNKMDDSELDESDSQCKIAQNDFFTNLGPLKAYLKSTEKSHPSHLLDELLDSNSDSGSSIKQSTISLYKSNRTVNQDYVQVNELSNIIVDGMKVTPYAKLSDVPLERAIHDYLCIKGFNEMTEFESYCWKVVLRGRHLFAMPNPNRNHNDLRLDNGQFYEVRKERHSFLSYLCPLVSLIIEKVNMELRENMSHESGYIKKSLSRSQNGPVLLIVCPSCKNAQKIYEVVNEMIEISGRREYRDEFGTRHKRKIRAILLQGGGNEEQYHIPLFNGCDILISATPFCLLRMLGKNHTNLERLQYLVLDEAYLLVEKFGYQMRVLMAKYCDLLRINERQNIAQIILMSSMWSAKLAKFVDAYLLERVFIATNKLEASYHGQTQHVIHECKLEEKYTYLVDILKKVNSEKKNTVIFVNKMDSAARLFSLLKHQFLGMDSLNESSKASEIKEIEVKWAKNDKNGLILICDEFTSRNLGIENADCVVNYDFPATKTSFANRLWYMRRYFSTRRKTKEKKCEEENGNDDRMDVVIKDEIQLPEDESERLRSFILFTEKDLVHAEGLLNFLMRIGYDEQYLPKNLLDRNKKRQVKNEAKKKDNREICPYLNSFGRCMSEIPASCVFRHKFYPEIDKQRDIFNGLMIPSEGFVKVRNKLHFISEKDLFMYCRYSRRMINP